MALAEDWSVQPPPDSYETLTFGQDIALKPFALLSPKNALLNLVTLTLYRFWARTEVRRRLWARVTLNGEPFEYTGRGMELFLGFLIALGTVGVPFLVVVFAIQFLGPIAAVPLALLLYMAMFILLGTAIFLAFRYQASRTTWRGIRFKVTGSPFEFGLNYFAYLFVTGITFGWFQPAMKLRVAEHMWGNLRFGNLKLRWVDNPKESVYKPFAIGWFSALGAYLVAIGGFIGLAATAGLEPGTEPSPALFIGLYLMVLALGLAVMVAFTAYQAAVLRRIVSSLKLSEASFKLDLTWLDLAGLILSNIALLVISLGLLMPFVQARTARFLIKRLSSTGEAPLDWAKQVSAGPKTGEGLADAFDFAPI